MRGGHRAWCAGRASVTEFLTAELIVANARALCPEVAARAAEAAALRRLPRDLVDKLKAAGCFRVMFPKTWGGPEMPFPMQVELIEVLAHADAAAAWCVKIGSDSGLFAAWLERARRARTLHRHRFRHGGAGAAERTRRRRSKAATA